jgi:hypothetical protein
VEGQSGESKDGKSLLAVFCLVGRCVADTSGAWPRSVSPRLYQEIFDNVNISGYIISSAAEPDPEQLAKQHNYSFLCTVNQYMNDKQIEHNKTIGVPVCPLPAYLSPNFFLFFNFAQCGSGLT